MKHSASHRLSDASPADIEEIVRSAGAPAFQARVVHDWVEHRGVFDPGAMHNVPKKVRAALTGTFSLPPISIETSQASGDETEKLLFTLADGQRVESVIIPAGERTTVCLSSQVGCAVRCRFCASGLEGGIRNLSAGEIFEQFMASSHRAAASDRRITNLVMMGMGEPMFNYEDVFAALARINAEDGPNLGARRITVSTIGIKKGVERFTNAKTQYTLAFSLHAPNDEIRRSVVPLKGAMSVDEIMVAASRYLEQTGREVTFEYVLLDGINASPAHARELAARMRRVRATVNLIPYNQVSGLPYRRPDDQAIDRFHDALVAGGARVSLRRRRGSDIAAACGQLALKPPA